MKVSVRLNGERIILEANPENSLSLVLRRLKLFSVKEFGQNGLGSCSTILMNGKPVPSDIIRFAIVRNAEIVTLEYFMQTPDYKDIITGFEQAGVKLCGYCNPGKIFTAYDIIQTYSRPTMEELENAVSAMTYCCTNKKAYISGIRNAINLRKKRIGNTRNVEKHNTSLYRKNPR